MALEGFGSSMFAIVTGQLIGAGKLPAATLPRAFVRLLASVRPLVGFQVRTFGVHLIAVREIAFVYASPLEAGAGRIFRRRRGDLAPRWSRR